MAPPFTELFVNCTYIKGLYLSKCLNILNKLMLLPLVADELIGIVWEETESQVSWSSLLQVTPGQTRIVGTGQIALALAHL